MKYSRTTFLFMFSLFLTASAAGDSVSEAAEAYKRYRSLLVETVKHVNETKRLGDSGQYEDARREVMSAIKSKTSAAGAREIVNANFASLPENYKQEIADLDECLRDQQERIDSLSLILLARPTSPEPIEIQPPDTAGPGGGGSINKGGSGGGSENTFYTWTDLDGGLGLYTERDDRGNSDHFLVGPRAQSMTEIDLDTWQAFLNPQPGKSPPLHGAAPDDATVVKTLLEKASKDETLREAFVHVFPISQSTMVKDWLKITLKDDSGVLSKFESLIEQTERDRMAGYKALGLTSSFSTFDEYDRTLCLLGIVNMGFYPPNGRPKVGLMNDLIHQADTTIEFYDGSYHSLHGDSIIQEVDDETITVDEQLIYLDNIKRVTVDAITPREP